MATQKLNYGSQTAITITLASLGATAARQSTLVDNTTDKFLDAMVFLSVIFANTAIGLEQTMFVYAYGWDGDSGTPLYTGGATGSDGVYTMTAPSPLKLIGMVPGIQNATVNVGPFSVAAGFGGILPAKWGLVVYNQTNIALTAGTQECSYVGITGELA